MKSTMQCSSSLSFRICLALTSRNDDNDDSTRRRTLSRESAGAWLDREPSAEGWSKWLAAVFCADIVTLLRRFASAGGRSDFRMMAVKNRTVSKELPPARDGSGPLIA